MRLSNRDQTIAAAEACIRDACAVRRNCSVRTPRPLRDVGSYRTAACGPWVERSSRSRGVGRTGIRKMHNPPGPRKASRRGGQFLVFAPQRLTFDAIHLEKLDGCSAGGRSAKYQHARRKNDPSSAGGVD